MFRTHKILLLLVLLLIVGISQAGVKRSQLEEGEHTRDIYIVSIGIDEYRSPFMEFKNCVRDSRAIVNKIISDNPCWSSEVVQEKVQKQGREGGLYYDSIYSIILNDSEATIGNIKDAFHRVSERATVNDEFIFFFGGVSFEFSETETVLVGHLEEEYDDFKEIPSDKVLTLREVARLMEGISCENQLIISEAGPGKTFAINLMSEMFESDPLIAATSKRNRIILTTTSFGFDFTVCNGNTINHGPLTYFMLNSGNILNVFKDFSNYEYSLISVEVACNAFNSSKYFAIYNEVDFRRILVNNYNKSASRGPKPKTSIPKKKKEITDEVKIWGLVIATNEYTDNTEWDNLSNPINDANEISKILENKYNVNVKRIYNKPRDTILEAILNVKNMMDHNDKLIFFIAGHGYYSSDWDDGYLVFSDSKSLEEDFSLVTYLNMAKLERMLDNMPARNVFVIFDVCFGASFNLSSKDLMANDYADIEMDITIDSLDARKSKHKSRIFIASGRYEVPDYWNPLDDHSPFASKMIASLLEEKSFSSPGKIFNNLQGNATEPFLKYFGKHEFKSDFILKVNTERSTR